MGSGVSSNTIFVSHSSADLENASEIYFRLKENGLPSWMAVHEIETGANYAEILFKTLESAKYVVLILSTEAITSDHVKREISLANQSNIPILTITFLEVESIKKLLTSDWQRWLENSKLLFFSTPREASRYISETINKEFIQLKAFEKLDIKTTTWIDNASILLSNLITFEDANFDFHGFNNELHGIFGFRLDELANSLDEEDKFIIGEFLYSCYRTFTTIRPDWIANDPSANPLLLSSYLIPAALSFDIPEATNSISFTLLQQDIPAYISWVEENYDFEEVLKRSRLVEIRTPHPTDAEFEIVAQSNKLGYLIFSSGLKLFAYFYSLQDKQSIHKALEWVEHLDSILCDKDLQTLENHCPTESFKLWLPLVELLSAFFHYVKGTKLVAIDRLSNLRTSKQNEFLAWSKSQMHNVELAKEHQASWQLLNKMLIDFTVHGEQS